MMDVTFVLEESGVTATVEVPCEADVAAAKEVACTALAVSPASVEMRIGTQVLEGTCRLQDTAFDAGVQVVLARRFADIKCPAEYSAQRSVKHLSLSRCGTLCVFVQKNEVYVGFDTETFDTVFEFKVDGAKQTLPAISQCKTRCYLAYGDDLRMVALPGGEVIRKVDGPSYSVFACGSVVLSQGIGVSVYDEDLTLLRSLSHQCWGVQKVALSHCGGWLLASAHPERQARLWDVNTGEAVACVPTEGLSGVALSRSASVFAVGEKDGVHLFDWSGAALGIIDVDGWDIEDTHMQFTPCGKYLVVKVQEYYDDERDDEGSVELHQYDVATMSRVRVIVDLHAKCLSFAISPCSRVAVFVSSSNTIVTKPLYPHNTE